VSTRRVVVHPDSESLRAGIAARMATTFMDVLAEQAVAHVVLTGGRNGIGGLAALSEQPLLRAVDFSRIHIWWGDERYLPTDDPDRNDTQSRDAMQGRITVPPTHLHPMPTSGNGLSAARASGRYAEELAMWAAPGQDLPAFDLVLLGVGADGHVASLFPFHPAVSTDGPLVVAVEGSPKPPPVRLSLSPAAICSASQVWLLASGVEKADAVRAAWIGEPDLEACPASVIRGRDLTLLLTDRAAASALARPF